MNRVVNSKSQPNWTIDSVIQVLYSSRMATKKETFAAPLENGNCGSAAENDSLDLATLRGYYTGLLTAFDAHYGHSNPYDSRTKQGKAWKRAEEQGRMDLRVKGRTWADAQLAEQA